MAPCEITAVRPRLRAGRLRLCCENPDSLLHRFFFVPMDELSFTLRSPKEQCGYVLPTLISLAWQQSRIKQHLASRHILFQQVGRCMSIWTAAERSTRFQEGVNSSHPPSLHSLWSLPCSFTPSILHRHNPHQDYCFIFLLHALFQSL